MDLTREQVLMLQAGPALDALVAKHVFGGGPKSLLPYSTDSAAAHFLEDQVERCMFLDFYLSLLMDMVAKNCHGSLHIMSAVFRATPEQKTRAALLAVLETQGD